MRKLPRLRDIKTGFNQVTVVHKDSNGWWVVRKPFALYPDKYATWETAIISAIEAPTDYSGDDVGLIMINRKNVQTHE